jgi:hypothetical protein
MVTRFGKVLPDASGRIPGLRRGGDHGRSRRITLAAPPAARGDGAGLDRLRRELQR